MFFFHDSHHRCLFYLTNYTHIPPILVPNNKTSEIDDDHLLVFLIKKVLKTKWVSLVKEKKLTFFLEEQTNKNRNFATVFK